MGGLCCSRNQRARELSWAQGFTSCFDTHPVTSRFSRRRFSLWILLQSSTEEVIKGLEEVSAQIPESDARAVLEVAIELACRGPEWRPDQVNTTKRLIHRAGPEHNLAPALHNALMCVPTEEVKLLLEAGADVNYVDPEGMTSLFIACTRTVSLHVRLLLEAGANVDQEHSDGATALFWATHSASCVKLLLEAGADVNKVDNDGLTALSSFNVDRAFWEGKDRDKETAAVVKLLLAAGAKVNIPGRLEDIPETPLLLLFAAVKTVSLCIAQVMTSQKHFSHPAGMTWI